MHRQVNRLTALAVSRAKKRGMYADGAGLYLQVTTSNAKSWVYRYMLNGKPRYMGLGAFPTFTLADARLKALEARRLRGEGVDPIDTRNAARDITRLEAAKSITFKDAAEQYMEAHRAGWRNPKHAKQWSATLQAYCYPSLGAAPVQAVDVALVMKVLEPIWATKTETASRVRGRIESVLDWASARGYRQGDNPARWRGHLENLLPRRSRVQKIVHHPALPYGEIGAFVENLRTQEGTAANALLFLILTACRTGEVIRAKWGEFNISEASWTIPAERVKTGREHRIPLSPAALAVINAQQAVRATNDDDEFVFPGRKWDRPLSNMTIPSLLKRMERNDFTIHGFRSSFRDWAAERTNYPREVAEMALGHAVGDKVEAAYRRSDLFEKRRRLMNEWARFCHAGAKVSEVVAIRDRQAK